MNNKTTVPWIVAIILLITNLISVYYLWQYNKELEERNSTIFEYQQGTRTSGTGESGGSEDVNLNQFKCSKDEALYSTGKQYKFMICYPMSWWLNHTEQLPEKGRIEWIGFTNIGEDTFVNIEIIDTNMISFSTKKNELAQNTPGTTYLGEETKTINGETFTQLNFKNTSNNKEHATFLIEKNSFIYILYGYSKNPTEIEEKTANNMIESFEFLNF